MRTQTMALLALLAVAAPAVGSAQSSSRLAIGAIRGDASRVRRQILLQLCGPYDCVAASRVTTDDRPDPEKLRRAGVMGYLGGAVTGEPGERRLFLSLTTQTSTARKPAKTWRLRLTPDGQLRPQVLERFSIELDDLLQGAAARAPAPAAPPQRAAPPPPPPAAKPPPRPPPSAATEPPPKAPPPAAKPAEKPVERPRVVEQRQLSAPYTGPVRVAAEVGTWITGRKLSYSGVNNTGATTPLRTYDASLILVPSLRLELFPMAFTDASPWLVGLGVYADYGRSIGLKVKSPDGSGNRNGTLTRLDFGALWRLQPLRSSRWALIPAFGYRSLQVTTSGTRIDGLPDTRPSGFELRVDTEVPLAPSFKLLGGAGYTLWTSKRDLVSSKFFDKGSARGWDVNAGASWRFWGPLSAKGLVEYESISYSGLKNPRLGLGSATGASDTYFGGKVMIRAEF